VGEATVRNGVLRSALAAQRAARPGRGLAGNLASMVVRGGFQLSRGALAGPAARLRALVLSASSRRRFACVGGKGKVRGTGVLLLCFSPVLPICKVRKERRRLWL